ncbi:LuxR family transcriptional regulator [Nocardia stercoris]|uniref:LuxR family transcriptional regulator n=2 Tax=Nocardia stercoris TaxID=2483361 RepID=A0A3M2KU65_9NOCA|nr:LuxR family transcriptional regulator [Nocardia stercoris]
MTDLLYGRDVEHARIGELLDRARAGHSGALVLRGDPGIGKTALLDDAAATAGELRVLRGMGIESEAELPFAGLQLLLRPALGGLSALPEPQHRALSAALGLPVPAAARTPVESPSVSGAGAAEPMLIGLAVLSLLAEYAGDAGLLCLIDDAHWLDRSSCDALLFAARRLYAEGVVLLFAARDSDRFTAPGLPEHRLDGLAPEAAAALLDRHQLSPALRYRLLTEARGNPLALRELPLALADSPDAPAGPLTLTDRLLAAFHDRVDRLPTATRTLLLIVAADDTGDLAVVLRAARDLGAAVADLAPAESAGLLTGPANAGAAVSFRHPLIRAAVYQRAPLVDRIAVHRALAAALDTPDQADRRAWHLAAATTGPDDEVAALLEQTADRARDRSGHEAAAVAYERAAQLSTTAPPRQRRRLLAAESALLAGDLDHAAQLVTEIAPATETAGQPLVHAERGHLLGLVRFWQGDYAGAHTQLFEAADRVAADEPSRAAVMLMQAVHTAWYLGEAQLVSTLDRLAALPLAPQDPLLPAVGYVRHLMDWGNAEPTSALRDMVAEVRARGGAPESVLLMSCGAALARAQDDDAFVLANELIAGYRAAGAAGRLPTVLFFAAEVELFAGYLIDGITLATEARALAHDTGQRHWVGQIDSLLARFHADTGDEQACRRHAEAGSIPGAGGSAPGASWAHWALGLLDLGWGRAESAVRRLEPLAQEPYRHQVGALRAVPDLVEAAVRIGEPERAAAGMDRLIRWAASVRRPWVDALVLRCRALLDDAAAEACYREALDLHDIDTRPVEYARTALLYGEWLRRARRRSEARPHLSAALEVFERVGMRPWAERTRAELLATGATDGATRPRGPVATLTPQELQIVRLAARGLSNRDIAAQLFLSHRTVGFHLYKAYPKLGVTSRTELKDLAAELG